VIIDVGKWKFEDVKKFSGSAAILSGEQGEETMAVAGSSSGEDKNRVMMIEGRVLKPEDRIHDLLEVLEDEPYFQVGRFPEGKTGPDRIYDLVDVVERRPKMALVDPGLRGEIMKKAADVAERVAREIMPEIAERIIREEIEKLKKGQ